MLSQEQVWKYGCRAPWDLCSLKDRYKRMISNSLRFMLVQRHTYKYGYKTPSNPCSFKKRYRSMDIKLLVTYVLSRTGMIESQRCLFLVKRLSQAIPATSYLHLSVAIWLKSIAKKDGTFALKEIFLFNEYL